MWLLVLAAFFIAAVVWLLSYKDVLHPTQLITGALAGKQGGLLGTARKMGSRLLYEYLAISYPHDFWTCMNYGYADIPTTPTDNNNTTPTSQPPPAHMKDFEGAEEYYGLRLYHEVASSSNHGADLAGLDVVEIGCGRGGGASYVSSRLKPRKMVGVDFSNSAIAFCNQRHKKEIANGVLHFEQGDAENLSNIEENSQDIVLNVESAHCYSSMSKFFAEVKRILRKDGYFLFAGFVKKDCRQSLLDLLEQSGLTLVTERDITQNILLSLQLDEERKSKQIDALAHKLFRGFARGAYALKGTNMRNLFETGQSMYILLVLQKQANE